MTKDEALRVALEALEDLGMKHYESTGEVLYKETFTAIKEALAQPTSSDYALGYSIGFGEGHSAGKTLAQPDNQGKIQTVDSSTERKAD